MRKFRYREYLLLGAALLLLFHFPRRWVETARSGMVCGLSFEWMWWQEAKEKALILFQEGLGERVDGEEKIDAQMQVLRQENEWLRSRLEEVRNWFVHEERLNAEFERWKAFQTDGAKDIGMRDFFSRRGRELALLLTAEVQSVPAAVVFREPANWSSSIWINVGEEDNVRLNRKVVGINSPVLKGRSLIGRIEWVGEKRSRVRLITDARFHLSVRAVRGEDQEREKLQQLELAIEALTSWPGEIEHPVFSSIAAQLTPLKYFLAKKSDQLFLAKGEIRGNSAPLWRARQPILKGIGFNYDFSDGDGMERDLRTGKSYKTTLTGDSLPLIREGDLLVTTGLDGAFPAGLWVATVSKVESLKEGTSSYSIEARPTAGDLDALTHLRVLPCPQ